MVTHVAQCCNPEPGEAIVAYVTHSHGVSIPRADCPNVRHLDAEARRRLLEAQWSGSAADTWPVHIEVIAHDRPGLLRDITALVADEGINVVAVNTVTHKKSRNAEMRLALEVSNLDQVSQLLSRINHLPNVSEARRLPEGDQDH